MEVLRRSRGWRLSRSLAILAVVVVVAPAVTVIPPHAPWLLGVVGVGGNFAWRRWQERYTLVRLDAVCPRCSAAITRTRPTRLRSPHPLPCDSCHHHASLEVEVEG